MPFKYRLQEYTWTTCGKCKKALGLFTPRGYIALRTPIETSAGRLTLDDSDITMIHEYAYNNMNHLPGFLDTVNDVLWDHDKECKK